MTDDDKSPTADEITLTVGDEEIPVADIGFDTDAAGIDWDECSPDAVQQRLEFSFGFEFEAPPRDIERIVGSQRVDIDADLPGFEDGTYRRCPHCEDTLIHTDHFETHLEDDHNLER